MTRGKLEYLSVMFAQIVCVGRTIVDMDFDDYHWDEIPTFDYRVDFGPGQPRQDSSGEGSWSDGGDPGDERDPSPGEAS